MSLISIKIKTSLRTKAYFLILPFLLTASPKTTAAPCHKADYDNFHTISAIQGEKQQSPLTGQLATTLGVVSGHEFRGARMTGFYIEMPRLPTQKPTSINEESVARKTTEGYLPSKHMSANKAPRQASTGLHIYAGALPPDEINYPAIGKLIAVQGKINEYHGSTQIVASKITKCDQKVKLAPAPLIDQRTPHEDPRIPEGFAELERLEHMRVRLQSSRIVAMDTLLRYGDITIKDRFNRTLQLDDNNFARLTLTSAKQNHLVSAYMHKPIRGGDLITDIQGILTYRYKRYRILLTQQPTIERRNHRPRPLAKPQGASVRIISSNLYNYFNGQATPSSPNRSDQHVHSESQNAHRRPPFDRKQLNFARMQFTQQRRGAKTTEAFRLQNEKLLTAWHYLKPDIALLAELENDEPPLNALQTLLTALNHRFPASHWVAAEPPTLSAKPQAANSNPHGASNDNKGRKKQVIRNAIIYDQNRVTPIGTAKRVPLAGPDHEESDLNATFKEPARLTAGAKPNRDAIIQPFNLLGSPIILGIVHLKSRGWCNNNNNNSEAPCGENARLKGIISLVKQLNTTRTTHQTLIMGDFNALPHEPPLEYLVAAGFTPLINKPRTHSYRFRGDPILLDHAFLKTPKADTSSPAHQFIPTKAFSARSIPMNSDEAPFLHPNHRDHPLYEKLLLGNTSPASSDDKRLSAFRFSDHDPIVVDLKKTDGPAQGKQ